MVYLAHPLTSIRLLRVPDCSVEMLSKLSPLLHSSETLVSCLCVGWYLDGDGRVAKFMDQAVEVTSSWSSMDSGEQFRADSIVFRLLGLRIGQFSCHFLVRRNLLLMFLILRRYFSKFHRCSVDT